MAAPATRRLTIYAGDTYDHVITFETDDDPAQPVPLDDRTWTAQWRPSRAIDDEAVDFTVDDTDAATGVLVISLTAAQTTELATNGVWDLQGEFADGTVETVLTGPVDWTKDVTR